MKIKTITASESIETIQPNGLKKWKKTEIMAELTEGEDEHKAGLELHRKAEVLNEGVVVSVRLSELVGQLPEIQVDKGDEAELLALVEDIKQCPDLHNLGNYKWVKGSDPRIKEAYEKRLKELSSKKKNGKPVLP